MLFLAPKWAPKLGFLAPTRALLCVFSTQEGSFMCFGSQEHTTASGFHQLCSDPPSTTTCAQHWCQPAQLCVCVRMSECVMGDSGSTVSAALCLPFILPLLVLSLSVTFLLFNRSGAESRRTAR